MRHALDTALIVDHPSFVDHSGHLRLAGSKPSASDPLRRVQDAVNQVILGHEHAVRLALACLLGRGHLLIEDMPGVGKTTLAKVLARVLGLEFSRIQFTSDLLPADIIGVSTYHTPSNEFHFHPGPIFASVVLADEINRATPKAQSALLEAMEEGQVTVEGETRVLPHPFFVIATRNPHEHVGTFELPESQLDRFMMRIHLGYPDRRAELRLLQGVDRREMLAGLTPVIEAEQLAQMQANSREMHTSDALLDYVQAIVQASREAPWLSTGLSPRAGLALVHAARAWALLAGRRGVLPEDVQAVAPGVLDHRLPWREPGAVVASAAERILRSVPIP